MTEYIEREAALRECQYDADGYVTQGIKAIPAADVVPVRHAYWRHYDTTMGGTKLYVCSLCDGDSKTENEIKRCLYCPNCGALMDKDGDGE